MLSPFSHWTRTACRLGLVAAVVAALAGSMRFVRSPPDRQRGRESLPLEPARRSDFWGKPKPWCLDCHRQGDHRIDPSKRTAYAQLTLGEPALVANQLSLEPAVLADLVAGEPLGPAQR
jgi:hypothetical protein